MPTLIEIARLEEIVLYDSSAIRLGSFINEIYDVRRYADFNMALLVDTNEAITQFLEFFQQPNTYTVAAALEDFKNLNMIIGSRQKHLNQTRNPQHDDGQKETLFSNVSDAIFSISRLARANVFKPEDDQAFNIVYEELPHLYFLATSSDKLSQKNRQLYAAAFYLSLFKKSTVALAVRSIQFEVGLRLLVEKIMNTSESHTNLQQSPIKLYGSTKMELELRYTTQNEKPA